MLGHDRFLVDWAAQPTGSRRATVLVAIWPCWIRWSHGCPAGHQEPGDAAVPFRLRTRSTVRLTGLGSMLGGARSPPCPARSQPSGIQTWERPTRCCMSASAPNSALSASTLRMRLRKHIKSNIGSSTFRLSLAALLWEREGWWPKWTDRPVLESVHLSALVAGSASICAFNGARLRNRGRLRRRSSLQWGHR